MRPPAAAPAARPPPRRRAGAAPRAAVLDETQVNALKTVAEREPTNPTPRVSSATSTSTPSGTTMRSSGTARR